jgi:D-alanyl-D-alanine endopeptidase (penicillin-binding protein 7)
MNPAVLVASLGWTLLHFIWQGALIGCATAILLMTLRHARPETRYAVGCAALLACLAWPVLDLVLFLRTGETPQAANLLRDVVAAPSALANATGVMLWLQDHLPWIVSLWAACAAALGLRMVVGLAWIERASRDDGGDPYWQARLAQMASRCGLNREVHLRIVQSLSSPVTAGWWRPVVLVPAALVAGMPPHLLEALLAHELGHIKRHDYLVNLCQNVVETLLFYHPAVWWISHRIRLEREQIADDFAVRELGEPRRLALALSELERLQFSRQCLAQAAAGGDLMARIRRLLQPDVQRLNWRAALPVLGMALACATAAHALTLRQDRAGAELAQPGAAQPAIVDVSSCAQPKYPAADLAAEHQGTVTLGFLVSPSGRVDDARIVRSSGFDSMDEAARGALRQCRFHPALKHGLPVKEWTKVMYVWTLA